MAPRVAETSPSLQPMGNVESQTVAVADSSWGSTEVLHLWTVFITFCSGWIE